MTLAESPEARRKGKVAVRILSDGAVLTGLVEIRDSPDRQQGDVTMISRRTFIKFTGATTLTLFAAGPGGLRKAIAAALPGGTLDPLAIPKFAAPLLIPPAMPRAGKITAKGGKNIDYYEIAVRQFQQQILP